MAADERLLAPVRRFWSKAEVETAYRSIFDAYNARLDKVTVIVGKSNEGESAQGQVVVNGEDYLKWMEALEQRLQEIAAEENGGGRTFGTEMVNFGAGYARG